jgi:hypothetical protein
MGRFLDDKNTAAAKHAATILAYKAATVVEYTVRLGKIMLSVFICYSWKKNKTLFQLTNFTASLFFSTERAYVDHILYDVECAEPWHGGGWRRKTSTVVVVS